MVSNVTMQLWTLKQLLINCMRNSSFKKGLNQTKLRQLRQLQTWPFFNILHSLRIVYFGLLSRDNGHILKGSFIRTLYVKSRDISFLKHSFDPYKGRHVLVLAIILIIPYCKCVRVFWP